MLPAQIPSHASAERSPPRPAIIILLILLLFAFNSSATAQQSRPEKSLYVRVDGGLSGYLGDNNTRPFNPDVFGVDDKWPYSVGVELGYQFRPRWGVSLGMQAANYPIITRFAAGLNVENHPTTRRTVQLLIRHLVRSGQVAPYVQFGYHVTFGDVTIFEESRLENGTPLNTQYHYIHGPLLGVGLDYAVHPRFSVFAEASAHATLMDDSVDGRLPLGPPQPTNLDETNRFGTFDLLNAYGFGVAYRMWHQSDDVDDANSMGVRKVEGNNRSSGRSMVRVSRTFYDGLTTLSFHHAPRGLGTVFLGIEGGLGPRSIFVRYAFQDGRNLADDHHFTGAFVGLSARWFPLETRRGSVHPHIGVTAAIPAQAHLVAGIDVSLGSSLTVGAEGRYTYCPTRKQFFEQGLIEENISYRMTRDCEYQYDLGLTMGYTIH